MHYIPPTAHRPINPLYASPITELINWRNLRLVPAGVDLRPEFDNAGTSHRFITLLHEPRPGSPQHCP